ncbi:MAG: autotransporter-associated beta strand repeat-containing protein, partial [Verrucomicrobiota bacterium]
LGAAADGGLTKLGGGTLVLSRASTYTGPTTNNAGTLKAGVAWVPGTGGAFGNNSPVILSNRAGVVLDITGFNTQIGSLTGGGAAGGNVTLGAATLTIGGDNSNPAAYAGIISDSGAVTKIGSGTLTLAGANTYSGATAVNAGALIGVTGGSCAGSIITVAAGATNGVQLLTDGGQWTCAGLINNSGGYLDFNMADTTAAPLQVNGNLGLSSSLKIIVRGAVSGAAGTHYPLIAYTGNLSGSVPGAALSLPVGMSGYITNNNITANGTIDLVLTANYTVAASTLYWAAGGGNWDIGTTLGWKNTAAPGAPNVFYPDNVPVVLDDSASGASPIVVTATTTVSPTSVTANLTNKNYVLSGGMIAGGGALTKNGPGTLTLLGGESYTGITAINGGTLQLGDGTANNCDLAGDITNNAALVFAAPYPQDFSHVISGSGAVTKSGAGTVTLYGANTYAGNTAINAGGLMVGGGGAINSPAAMLNIGDVAGTSGTATLGDGGVIAVRTLLATNGVIGGAVNSHFNFTGGSLTTSNSPGAAAATILLPANTAFNIDGNWMMNGGVHTIATVQTNGSYYGTVNVGHLANNVTVGVNAGAVWSLGSAITNIGLCVGNGPTANDALWVNNGSLFVTNAGYTPLVIGNNADSQGNQLVITNGGQVVCGTLYGANSASVGNNGNNNSATVAGTNAAGLKATWNLGASRLYIGTGATTTGNWVQVGPGGVITNVSNSGIISWGTNSSLIITNGGQVFTAGATVGRGATDNSFMVAGTDSAGNPATLNMEGGLNNLQIGIFGTSNPGNNNKVWLGQGGLVTNVASVLLGGVDSALYLNGGTLAAGNTGNLMATNSTTVNATVFVQSGGAVINTAGYTVASQLPLTEDPGSTGGGLTKLGSGTLTLLAANTYTGNTTVSNGTLSIQQPTLVSGSTVVVAGGAVLDLGFAGTNTVASLILSGSVMPGGVYNSNLTSQITGPGSLLVSGGGGTINPNPPQLQVSCSGGNLSLGWPNNLGWILQSNSVSPAAPGAWHNYPADGSVSVTSVSIPVNKGVTNVFFRMLKP